MRCWNCLNDAPKKAHRCGRCDQPLKPNAAQAIASKRNLNYLLHEIEDWSFLKEDSKQKVRRVYEARQGRLAELRSSKAWVEWPVSDWTEEHEVSKDTHAVEAAENIVAKLQQPPLKEDSPETTPTPQPISEEPVTDPPKPVEEKPVPELTAPTPRPLQPMPVPEKSLVATLVGEADIRWFHSLGAILVVAAVVGWLRASWDSYGKVLAGLLIASSPIILHFVAQKLKKSVPLSSRLLAILANILTPPALLALDVFGALPDFVPGKLYWTCALLVSAAILSWQAEQTQEKVPLFVGALCAVMAGWSQGALTTAMCSLGLGFLFAWDTQSDKPEWAKLRKTVSFYAGSFGAITTLVLFDTTSNPFLPVTAFTASLIFLHFPTLSGQTQSRSGSRVFMQTAMTLIGSILMRAVLDVPAGGVAMYLIFACALFLTAKPDSELASAGAKVATGLGAFALAMGFLSDLPSVFSSQQSLQQAGLRFLFTSVSAGFFWMTSRRNKEEQTLFLLGLLSLLGGWIHLLLFAITRGPLERPDQFVPLLASIPVFGGLLLIGSRWMRNSEQKTLGIFLFPVLASSMAITAMARLVNPDAGTAWECVLAFHVLLSLAWERQWLSRSQEFPKWTLQGLPRLTIAGGTLLLLAVLDLPIATGLFAATAGLVAASFLLKVDYSKASFEMGWIVLWLSLPLSKPIWLLSGALLSFAFSLNSSERREVSLVCSTVFSLCVLVATCQNLHFSMMFLPALVFAISLNLPTKLGEKKPINKLYKYGFDVLLGAAVFLGDVPSNLSLAFCLTLAALAFSFALLWNKKQELAQRVLSRYSGPALFGVLVIWSLGQTTLETGILMLLASTACFFLIRSPHRYELANALAIFGTAQLACDTHFLLDPVIVGGGILISEFATLLTRRPSTQLSNLALLIVASVQGQTSMWAGLSAEVLLFAALVLALRCVQQDLMSTAVASAAMFLWKVDPYLADDVDFRLRVLPTAAVFIGCALWKWKKDFPWTRPVLHIGLGLLVAPACLQFIVGYDLAGNFAWMLACGCSFLGFSFALPQSLRMSFRQAGGYTLIAWAGVSLTRAALELPWQAATLLVGLALVTVGVVVERRNRKATSSESQDSNEQI
jgi:hypothetical protein